MRLCSQSIHRPSKMESCAALVKSINVEAPASDRTKQNTDHRMHAGLPLRRAECASANALQVLTSLHPLHPCHVLCSRAVRGIAAGGRAPSPSARTWTRPAWATAAPAVAAAPALPPPAGEQPGNSWTRRPTGPARMRSFTPHRRQGGAFCFQDTCAPATADHGLERTRLACLNR